MLGDVDPVELQARLARLLGTDATILTSQV